jgi:hypothetical protein
MSTRKIIRRHHMGLVEFDLRHRWFCRPTFAVGEHA